MRVSGERTVAGNWAMAAADITAHSANARVESFMNPPVNDGRHNTQFVWVIQLISQTAPAVRAVVVAMIPWISGRHDPQLVPHLSRLPISTALAQAPSSFAQIGRAHV